MVETLNQYLDLIERLLIAACILGAFIGGMLAKAGLLKASARNEFKSWLSRGLTAAQAIKFVRMTVWDAVHDPKLPEITDGTIFSDGEIIK